MARESGTMLIIRFFDLLREIEHLRKSKRQRYNYISQYRV